MATLETHARSRLAAVVFDRDEDVDATIGDFVAFARHKGARVAGFVQERGCEPGSPCHDMLLRDLVTGAEFAIMQDLGPEASGCRLDSGAIALAAGLIGRAIAEAPDLLVINRFGKLECEGGGLLAELAEAVARGLPVVICVPLRFREAWAAFAEGLDAQLPPRLADLEDWWAEVAPARPQRSFGGGQGH
jgi:hypothetical protein